MKPFMVELDELQEREQHRVPTDTMGIFEEDLSGFYACDCQR